MRYHKTLTRKELLKYGWRKLLMMAASEFSRAESLSHRKGGKELESCLMRAKELLGVMETDGNIPPASGLKMLSLLRSMTEPSNADVKKFYSSTMRLAAS